MRLSKPPQFSFSPLLALIPGLMMLAGFSGGGVTTIELLASGAILAAGAAWAGLRGAQQFITEPVETFDIALATAVLNALPDPVMLLDGQRRVMAFNAAASDALSPDMHERDLCLILRQPDAQQAIKAVVERKADQTEASLTFEAPVRRYFQLQAVAMPAMEARSIRAVVALHEVTALKAAEDMRADFVANVSHELRSPLSSLTGFIETLQGPAREDAEAQTRFLGIMADEAGRMSRLIEDLLSLSKIEASEHVRPSGSVDVTELLQQLTANLAHRTDGSDARLSLELPSALPQVIGDRDQLTEVFENLIENALKYGGAGGVRIKVAALDTLPQTGTPGISVSIEDRGEGIPPQHIPRLTERFYRVDKGRSRAVGGTGLGLAIVKHIVNRHRGRLLIQSKLGEGSVFTVQLPAKQA